jgi:hypothetical protein
MGVAYVSAFLGVLLGRSYRLHRQTADMIVALLHTLANLADTVALVDQQSTARALHVPPVTYFHPSQVGQRAKRSVFDNEITNGDRIFYTLRTEFEKHNRVKPS